MEEKNHKKGLPSASVVERRNRTGLGDDTQPDKTVAEVEGRKMTISREKRKKLPKMCKLVMHTFKALAAEPNRRSWEDFVQETAKDKSPAKVLAAAQKNEQQT